MKKSVMTLLLFVIVLASAAMLFLVRHLERTGVFFPGKDVFANPSQAGLPYEDIFVTTADGIKITGWFLKNPQAKSTIIFAHGNAGTMADRLLKVKYFYDLGLNVLIFDYRGYGRSEGHPTEKGIYLDAQAVYDYLAARNDVDMANVIVYGASLGGIVAVDLALNRPVAALIVDSSITSARETAKIFYPYIPAFLLELKFDSINKVKKITAPKVFLHSPDDQTVPYWMGQKLFAAASEPKEFITSSGGHNEIQIVSDHKTGAALRNYLISRGLL